MSSESIFKKLDTFVFNQIDSFFENASVQPLLEKFTTLDEDTQKGLNQIFAIFTILIPVAIVIFFLFQNNMAKRELETKQEIFEQINEFTAKNNQLMAIQSQILSSSIINNDSDLNNKINIALNNKKIPAKNLSISNFMQTKLTIATTQTNADINFSSLSAVQLKDLLQTLTQRERLKATQLNIRKDAKSKLLDGKVHIIHFGRAN